MFFYNETENNVLLLQILDFLPYIYKAYYIYLAASATIYFSKHKMLDKKLLSSGTS